MNTKNPQVDEYISKAKHWQEEMKELRTIALDCGLTEEIKWRAPCYTFQGNNIVMLAPFKDFCALSFIKGVLLQDADGILVKPGENSQSVRFARFNSVQEIIDKSSILKAYIFEAIEAEKAGLKVDFKDEPEPMPQELKSKLESMPALKKAFFALTPGRQRAYILYFSAATQSKTRFSRIENYVQRILSGKGINDCVCGLSKRMPNCDGSHKFIKK